MHGVCTEINFPAYDVNAHTALKIKGFFFFIY